MLGRRKVDLFCGCNYWRMCMYHSCISAEYYAGPYGPVQVDLQAEYALRCRAVAVMEQFRKVLAVIGWAAQWCPRRCGRRHRGAFYEMVCREGAPW